MKFLIKANGLKEHILINKNEMKISPPTKSTITDKEEY